MLECPAVLFHSREYHLLVSLEALGRMFERAAILLHRREHYFAVGLETLVGILE